MIKIMGEYVGTIVTIVSGLIFFVKPIRVALINWIRKNANTQETDKIMVDMNKMLQNLTTEDSTQKKMIELQSEALLCVLRDNITSIYYQYRSKNTIPLYERENVVKQYDIYHSMHGNSYVDIIYNEILEIPVLD